MIAEPASDAAREARAFAQRLAALEEGRIRARAAARALATLEPEQAGLLLSALLRDASSGARVAVAAVAQALLDPEPELPHAWRSELHAACEARAHGEVTALLLSPPPLKPFTPPLDKPDAKLAHLTLGHKKVFARTHHDPDLLARLAAEGEPGVVRELLRNAQLTEAFVVRIAARRPCRPGTLRCIIESRRWRVRPAVALAVVRNPYAEPEVALKLVPALGPAELTELSRDGTVHPLVRGLAEKLARERAR